MSVEALVFNLLNGLTLGMLLFLIGSGLSIVMGLMGITNIAHGAFYMLGGYLGWTLAVQHNYNFWIAALLAGIGVGVVGLLLERVFLNRLYKQPNEQVMLTFGFVYIITNLSLWIWGGRFRATYTAEFLNQSIEVFGVRYPAARLSIIVIGIILGIILWYLQEKTRIGAIVRAGMDDKMTTMGLGINLDRVFTAVFFFAAFLTGSTGVIGAQLYGVYTGLGIETLLLALIVVIVGGVGKVQGTFIGGIMVGLVEAFGRALYPGLSMFSVYFIMIMVLILRPQGILGKGVQQ